MLDRLILFSIRRRLIVAMGTVMLIVGGVIAFMRLPVDAVPDITSNQVQVFVNAPALAPVEVERLITFPVERSMANLPHVEEVRSISTFGLSSVTIVFTDDVDMYFARQLVYERLAEARAAIPAGVGEPTLGPVTTGLGEVYQYEITGAGKSAMELRTIQEWIVKRQLLGTPGVAEVNTWGGMEQQLQVLVHPDALVKYDLTLESVFASVERNNANAGGAYIEHQGEQYTIRAEGFAGSADDLRNIVVKAVGGKPVLLRDVATVEFGGALRQGAATRDGKGEAVLGITMMLKGENARETATRISNKIDAIRATLPAGVELRPFYNRTDLVDRAISTVQRNLIEGCLLVLLVVLLILANLRAGLIVASVIPLAMLFAFIGMSVLGITGNLMSLGAIDFGLLVDGTVIVVEHCLVFIGAQRMMLGRPLNRGEMDDAVRQGSIDIRKSAQFGVLIILIVYLPIYTLQGIEGKMFRPMAITVGLAILGALILSLTYVPMMCSLFLRRDTNDTERVLVRAARRWYAPLLSRALSATTLVLASAAFVLIAAIVVFARLGGEFIPTLDEGDIQLELRRLPSISLTEAIRTATLVEEAMMTFPEVKSAISKTGRPEIASDPMGIHQSDVYLKLKPRSEWTTASTKEELIAKMDSALKRIPGIGWGFSQPIEMRFNELMAGVRSDVGIYLYGADLDTLANNAEDLARVLGEVPGGVDARSAQVEGLPQLVIRPVRAALARYGLNISDVNTMVEIALAGKVAGHLFEGEKQFDLVVRYVPEARGDIEAIRALRIALPGGARVRLDEIADVMPTTGPAEISHRGGRRVIVAEANVRGRDVASYVHDLTSRIAGRVALPAGYAMEIGGEFRNLERARERLNIVVPIALLLILILLYATFGSIPYALLIFTGVPLSVVGGVASLWLRGMPFSISAGVGFIALFGVATLNGIVMIGAMRGARAEGRDAHAATIEGAVSRLRAVLTTALVASIGFIPMAISTGAGAEVQRPLATVVIGGLISSTVLTLFVLPVLFQLVERRRGADTVGAVEQGG